MNEVAQALLIAIQLFAILDPPGSIPVFLALTEGRDAPARARLARTITWLVLGLMVVFALAGDWALRPLGTSLESLKFGGGLLLLALSLDIVLGSRGEDRGREVSAVVPVATPLLVGPGTITALIIMSAYHPAHVLLAAVALASAMAYLCLRFSGAIVRLVGMTGVRAASRLMAVLVAAMAVEMIHSALLAWGIAES